MPQYPLNLGIEPSVSSNEKKTEIDSGFKVPFSKPKYLQYEAIVEGKT